MVSFKYDSTAVREENSPIWLHEHLDFISDWLKKEYNVTVTTSGSTGAPKVISMSKELMRASARLTAGFFDLKPGSSVLLALPSSYIAGKMVIVRALTNNWELWFTEPNANPLKEADQPFDFASFTPMQMQTMVDENPEKLLHVLTILVGGAEVKPALARRIAAIHGRCFETYGMTETVSHVAVRRIDGTQDVFEALPGVSFSADHRNCLRIAAGHLQREPIQTNDVVELIDAGHFRLLGRADDVINSGGIKLFPAAIESKIENVVEGNYYITSISHDTWGDALVLMIEGTEPAGPALAKLRDLLGKVLSRVEFPKEIKFVKQFSRTESGKIKRVYL